MADTTKSIQVNIGVVVDQAKKSMADLAAQTKLATDQMSNLGTTTTKSMSDTDKSMQTAAKSSGGFFSNLQKDIVTSLAAYDVFKKSLQIVGGFLEDSIGESMKASTTMAQVKVNVNNAGQSYAELGGQIDAYSKKQIQMGFDDEDTALSVSKLMLVTGDYNKALSLNQLAMDLARSKGIDLGSATKAISLVTQGNIKALKEYGIELGDTATISDVLNEAQVKLGGSAAAYSETAQGKLDMVKQQWDNIKQSVGDKLMPVMLNLFDTVETNLPEITSLFEGFGTAIGKTVDTIVLASGGLTGMYKLLKGTFSDAMGTVVEAGGYADQAINKLLGTTNKQDAAGIELGKNLHIVASEDFASAIDQGGSLKKTWDDLLGTTKTSTEATKDLSTATKVHTDAITVNGKASKEQTQAQKDHIQSMKELSQSFIDVTQKQDAFTFKSEADFTKFSALLEDTKMNQKDWISEAKQGFDAYSTEIKSVESDVKSLDDKIAAAKKTMADFLTSTTQSSGDSFASIVHDAQKSIPDLQKQIQEAQAGGNDTTDLQKKLNDANAIVTESQKSQYNDGSALAVEYHQQLDLLNKQDSENALQIAYETMLQKIADKQKETDAVIKGYEDQKTADNNALTNFRANQVVMTEVFAASVKARGATAVSEVASMDAITTAVNNAAAAYRALAAAQGTKAGAVSGKASGGPVSGGESYLVGEKGPELFTPNMGGSITPNDKVGMGGGVTININNPTVRSDSDLKAIVSMVQDALSRTEELSKIGAYK